MTKSKNFIAPKKPMTSAKAGKDVTLPNAIEPKTSSILLKKKRHMSGLMCPPPSFLASHKTDADRQ